MHILHQTPSSFSIPNGQVDGEAMEEDSTRVRAAQRKARPLSTQHPFIQPQRRALIGLT